MELASAALLTDEFFQLASERITPNGTIAVYLDLFYASEDSIDTVLRTFHRSFPHATAWTTADGEMVLKDAGNATLGVYHLASLAPLRGTTDWDPWSAGKRWNNELGMFLRWSLSSR